ncbi:hypothetical protein ACVI1L_004721 [Bradyrhizobium sp. USDA 4516]
MVGLAGAQRQSDRQTIAIDDSMNFARQPALIPRGAGSMLMLADNEGIDHLDNGMGTIDDAAPDASLAAISQVGYSRWCTDQTPRGDHAKVLRKAEKMPLRTRRSLTVEHRAACWAAWT